MPKKLRFVEERPDNVIEALREATKDNAREYWDAMTFGGFDPVGNQYGFGDLRPTHVGLTNSQYYGQWSTTVVDTAGSETSWFDTTVHEDSYILIHGVFNNAASPKINEMKLFLGGNELPWMNLQEIYGWDIARAYLEQGYSIQPKQSIKVAVTATATVATNSEPLGLVGEIMALRSYLIKYDAPTP